MKETEDTKMQIIKHQKQIIFSKIKIFEHKIMLKMN